MYEFQYGYVKQKYGEKPKLCYMDAVSFIISIKTEDIYNNITEVVEARFYISNQKYHYLEEKTKIIGLRKDKLGRGGNDKTFFIDTKDVQLFNT